MSLFFDFCRLLSPKIARYDHLLLAFSGGLDSRVLLDLLHRLQRQRPSIRVQVVHIHHGLSPHADDWLAFCRQCCQEYGLDFDFHKVTVDARGRGIEAAARDARYRQLQSHMSRRTLLLTGHHLDDQAETLLLALKRGAGPLGLAAMPQQQPFAAGELFRPLLSFSRDALNTYAREQQLRWIDDDSNADQRYDRNFLRQGILPQLAQRWPGFNQRVARSAQLCQELVTLADEVAAGDLAEIQHRDHSLAIELLEGLSQTRQHNLVRYWLRHHGHCLPSRRQLGDIFCQVIAARQDADPCVRFGETQIRRFRQRLYAIPLSGDIAGVVLQWHGQAQLILPDALGKLVFNRQAQGVRPPKEGERVTIRFQAPGALRCRPQGRQHSRALKKLWQEYGIAPWLRNRLPMVFYDEQLVMVVGGWIEQEFEVNPHDASTGPPPEALAITLDFP